MMKKLVTFILAVTMILSPVLNAVAAAQSGSKASTAAISNSTAAKGADSSESESSESTTEAAAAATEYSGGAWDVEDLDGAPDITAESAIVIDAATGTVLYGKEADTKRYPASITKVMTALLAIENCKMSDVMTYSNSAVNGIEAGSSTAGINVGAKLTVEQSLYALMLVSANEAAAAIAEHVSGSTEEFAKLMTQRAKELGCTGTNFKNPHGLPDENHYTTAHDMALIMREALKHDEFRKISSTISYTLKKSKTLTDTLELWNHAKILRESSDYYYKYAECAKTGYTQAALNTLVTSAKKDGTELICVILKDYGADNSYYDTAALYKYCFKATKQITPLSDCDLNALIAKDASISIEKRSQIKLLNCTYNANYPVLVKNDADTSSFTTSFKLDEDTTIGRLGYLVIKNGDTEIGQTPITYDLTSEQGKEYAAGKTVNDNLKTAPVKSKRKDTIRKMIHFTAQVLIIAIIVVAVVQIIRRRRLEKRRQKRILDREQKSLTPKNSPEFSASTSAARNRRAGRRDKKKHR